MNETTARELFKQKVSWYSALCNVRWISGKYLKRSDEDGEWFCTIMEKIATMDKDGNLLFVSSGYQYSY